ncbi:hypothetical protein K3725_19445 [Leisingera sp. S132]|uniref:hypothetical protein n=1 Tax=Leisingera sp. S132 TaxID=2867016 RepID=UPI0021A5D92E|nr:hypothetical protein [Leisingera sp. S132]UWQ79436.1 hypothetical protein K3725_19445 [Leisingera sp. S132]
MKQQKKPQNAAESPLRTVSHTIETRLLTITDTAVDHGKTAYQVRIMPSNLAILMPVKIAASSLSPQRVNR